MTIDRLNSTAGLLSLLRTEKSVKSERAGATVRSRAGASASRSRDLEALRRDLREIAQNAALDDPDAARAVQARMVRAILQWELGPEAREHPAWQSMVDVVTQTLQSADDWDEQFKKLLRQLKP